VTATIFRSVALFVWSRFRWAIVANAAIYAAIFILNEALRSEPLLSQFPFARSYLLIMPFVLPLALVASSTNLASLDLLSTDGRFPRNFFTLPVTAHQMALPFMLYAALLGALQWALAAVITNNQVPLWLSVLIASSVAWIQALMWTPYRQRWIRGALLVGAVFVYVVTIFAVVQESISTGVVIALSLAQFPLAYAYAVRGVSKSRRGEPAQEPWARSEHANAPAPVRFRAPPKLTSPLHAQLWVERRIHRWSGKVSIVFLVPFLLLLLVVLASLAGATERNPEALQMLGRGVIAVLLVSLATVGISTGLAFGSFRSGAQWNQPNAFAMPAFFAALPFESGDFAWTKIRGAATSMLWVSAGILLICVAIAWVCGYGGPWSSSFAAWRAQYGVLASVALAALPVVALIMGVLAATASVMWMVLLGRYWNWIFVIACFVFTAVVVTLPILATRPGIGANVLPGIANVVAALKVFGLAWLIYYVGSRRLLSWARLGVMAAFWAAAVVASLAAVMWYVPEDAIRPLTALATLIAVVPGLGAIAAPLALQWNRAR
jgi:hypothetical protein